MVEPLHDDLSQLVRQWSSGDAGALNRLTALLYDELRHLAHAHLLGERESHTLTTTALVHEAYVQLAQRTGAAAWQGRAQFFALVSRVMRHVLIDYARRRNADKRGGGGLRVELHDGLTAVETEIVELLTVNDALDRLAARDPRLAQIVECRFFGGMHESEIAEALGVSERTIGRDWRRARTYLFTLLHDDGAAAERLN